MTENITRETKQARLQLILEQLCGTPVTYIPWNHTYFYVLKSIINKINGKDELNIVK